MITARMTCTWLHFLEDVEADVEVVTATTDATEDAILDATEMVAEMAAALDAMVPTIVCSPVLFQTPSVSLETACQAAAIQTLAKN